jgi:hypothetical protein
VAVAGGIGGACLPDDYTVQFYPAADSNHFAATFILALSAQNRRGTPLFRGDAAATLADERGLFQPHHGAGAGHAHDSHPARINE